jgi:SAM-dependent methyltransferase
MEPFNGKRPAQLSPLFIRVLEEISSERLPSRSDGNAIAVAELSRLFTKERAALGGRYLDDPDLAAAYLSYFLPVNLSKIQVLLDELSDESLRVSEGIRFSVLDLGSGPGTGGLAVLDWLHRYHSNSAGNLSVVAVDTSGTALRQAERLWDAYNRTAGISGPRLKTYEANLERALKGSLGEEIRRTGPYDLIILANCLNEMWNESSDPTAARAGLVTAALSCLSPHGTVMIVEPALRETSRALHRVRDQLLQDKRCTVYSPCLHEGNCPALVNQDDWCHEERGWEAPAGIREIDQEVGFIKDALKFSYLLLRKDGRTIVERRPDIYRVVSELRELKGEKRAWLCNERGRSEVGRLDRLSSPENGGVDSWHRGAIVQIDRIVRKEHGGKISALGRIERDAGVQVIRPA